MANYRDMFESGISAAAKGKQPTKASGKSDAETIFSWSYDMERHGRSREEMCVEDVANLQIKQLSFTKSQRHASMTTNLKKKKLRQ